MRGFNIQSDLIVQLTDEGRAIEGAQRALATAQGLRAPERAENAKGESVWSGWDLMRTFGPELKEGAPMPFSTRMEIKETSSTPGLSIDLLEPTLAQVTEHGRMLLHSDRALTMARGERPQPFTLPREDAQGWSQWSGWDLMKCFGPHLREGQPLPISPEIQVADAPLAIFPGRLKAWREQKSAELGAEPTPMTPNPNRAPKP